MSSTARRLLAKCAAAHSRRKPKDWHDVAYVLLHNDAGGVDRAARAVVDRFAPSLFSMQTALDDLRDNFADPAAQAYGDKRQEDPQPP